VVLSVIFSQARLLQYLVSALYFDSTECVWPHIFIFIYLYLHVSSVHYLQELWSKPASYKCLVSPFYDTAPSSTRLHLEPVPAAQARSSHCLLRVTQGWLSCSHDSFLLFVLDSSKTHQCLQCNQDKLCCLAWFPIYWVLCMLGVNLVYHDLGIRDFIPILSEV